uniref:Cyclopropane synthase isoform 2 n=1 Tax=Litchi chinensis TaxID=151069 RepID=A0A346D9Y9_LITCN|nr:cyclopropane synthase isoform 2 [Litchi chinensis]
MSERMKVAVVGGGMSGVVAAHVLAKAGVEVVVYEKKNYLGGQAKIVTFDGVDIDLGCMLFNEMTCPNMMEMSESLGVEMEIVEMSLSVSLDKGQGYEWGTRNGLNSLFAQKKNVFNPYFWQMLREITKFKKDAISYFEILENNPDINYDETLEQFMKSHNYSELFQKAYLIPVCCIIWSCPAERVMSFPILYVFSVYCNHRLFQLLDGPQRLTTRWRSDNYYKRVKEQLENWGCQIRTSCEVYSVSPVDEGCAVICEDGSKEFYNGCIMAIHAPDALKMLGSQATLDELRILGAFQYVYSDIFLHRDKNFMPRNQAAWSACNFMQITESKTVCLTYWLNVLQDIGEKSSPFLVTLNPEHTPEQTLLKWSTGHPAPSVAASKASRELDLIQGKRGMWFCGAYQGYGFHEDQLKWGLIAAHSLLGKSCAILSNPRHMAPSVMETGARLFVTRFLRRHIIAGRLILMEDGGAVFNFEGTRKNCRLETILRIHNPEFYWKVMTEGDLGFADSYINGDFSFVDKDKGLLNLFMIFIANSDLDPSRAKLNQKRGWWSPMFFTAGIASAKYFFRHILKRNTLTQARRNISRHYDLSNDLFALFLDESMTYSCAVFKSEDEDLKVAQMRKLSLLIEKARISKEHEVLDIGCGWGSLAIEVVKRTGCKYTGITLSVEQIKYADIKVKEAGLQDQVTLILCDYRQLPKTNKYDRIISAGMIESVGHEYFEEFFGCCESLLAEDGLFVLQYISVPDQHYNEHRLSPGFIKEYIFPGGCLPSLNRITTAMTSASRLCVEHVENIGIHYHQTLRCWRKNLLERQREVFALGFDKKFIRTWEYYFDYCAAGFKSRTLGDYQMVFSRPGNVAAFTNPYKGFPSTDSVM